MRKGAGYNHINYSNKVILGISIYSFSDLFVENISFYYFMFYLCKIIYQFSIW